MMHTKPGCSALFLLFLVVLNIQSSIQHPLQDNSAEDNREDEGGSLTPEDFLNGLNIVPSDEEVHDEDQSADLFEGDIILSDQERTALEEGIDPRGTVVGSKYRKWPKTGGVVNVPYTFPSYLPTMRKAAVAKVVQEFNSKTCLRLIPRTNEQAYVRISPNHDDTSGAACASEMGYWGRRQTIYFASGCSWGNLAHEFMHAFGFFHEHTRSDRDNYITILWDKIDRNWRLQFAPCTAHPQGCNDLSVGYDYGSIMHYKRELKGVEVIIPKQEGVEIGQRERLSEKDVMGINEHYGCEPEFIGDGSSTNGSSGCSPKPDTMSYCKRWVNSGLIDCAVDKWMDSCATSCTDLMGC